MTTPLHAHQQKLLDRLRDPACPTRGVVTAPTGTGIRQPLVIRLAEVAQESLCLVVDRTRALAAQWAGRLEAAAVSPVILLTGADTALGILEKTDVPRNGIIVTTQASIQHKLVSDALAALEFELAIYDDPHMPPSMESNDLRVHARRIIYLVSGLGDAPTGQPIILQTGVADIIDKYMANSTRFLYEEDPGERDLRVAAMAALGEYAQGYGTPETPASDSLPVLHSQLLTATTRVPSTGNLADRIWQILDRMDTFAGPDSRLQALDRVVGRALATNARCVVMAPTVTDASYIAEHLSVVFRAPHAVITSRMKVGDRQSVLASTNPGEYVVATPVAVPARRWPENTTLILWPSPGNKELLPRLALPGSDVSLVEMMSVVSSNTAAVSSTGRPTPAQKYEKQETSPTPNPRAVAVLAPAAKGHRLADPEREVLAREIVRRYTAGESIRALTEATGRSYGYIHRILTESGVQLRQKGKPRRRKKA